MQLESVYAPPGFLLLARGDDGRRLGCVGVRALDVTPEGQLGEVRRLFVRPQGRGLGLGRVLIDRLMADARTSGLTTLALNTLPEMTEAIGLYESLGFTRCEPYVDEPLEGVLYFDLSMG